MCGCVAAHRTIPALQRASWDREEQREPRMEPVMVSLVMQHTRTDQTDSVCSGKQRQLETESRRGVVGPGRVAH